ncbi:MULTISPECIES: Cof-type HAD-IIB family hydrolase [Bacillaceae]|uniref:Cof-type HAD-IIB family hydrolase n=1 Tax=Bacillaceae TaxID=186817 RepID=UPI000BA567ED|nr:MULTISPECIES: Cof-type HAD-IIB family hydrolase [Bacillaceae]MCM3706091.1 Cof-type HAD-IIB family hydrolase [Cytobacillus firmus]PAE26298.1 phosphoglycolate phosphatase [Bacillus sp. 7894-2]URM31191.1 Cof-type HAD-IIB family hydrolase [Cytobacillus firmus]
MKEAKIPPQIKLIALDMDGTLLNSKGEIPEENRAAIKEAKEKGIEVILSTGRSRLTAGDHADSLKLNSYLITVNGSEIFGPGGESILRAPVDSKVMEWMWNLSKTHKTNFWATSCERVWMNEMPENIHDHEWLKFGFDISDDAIRELIHKELQSKGNLEITNSSLTNIEVNALGINKAKGILKVTDLLGISMENVMAMGDSLNDIAMIKESGWGIAMGNAQDIVKETADAVTGTNDEAGVALAIRKWAL